MKKKKKKRSVLVSSYKASPQKAAIYKSIHSWFPAVSKVQKGKEPCGMSHCLASNYSVDAALLWCSFADPICEDHIYSPHRTMGRSFRDKCYHNCMQFFSLF